MKYSRLSCRQWLGVVTMVINLFYVVIGSEIGVGCINDPCIYGICVPDINGTYACYCIDGFTGIRCQTNWNECQSSPCLNGGSCHDGVASYNCTCADGFAGENCEQDINECNSSPCRNGTCTDARNGYECRCFPGYSGVDCEVDLAVCNSFEEARCRNNGICLDGPGFAYTCQCQPGWTGKWCDDAIDECSSSPCLNGATCVDLRADYACACTFGFTGRNCETALKLCDFNLCENGAFCLFENEIQVCYCVPDYHGDRCQYRYDECQFEGRCVNGSTCVDGVDSYTCSCSVATSGPNCECSEQPDGEYECDATLVTDRATISVFNSTGRKRVSGFESTTTPFRVTNRTSPARFPNTRYTTTIDDVTAQTDKMISSTETVEGNNERTTSMATNAPTTTRKIPYRTVTGGATEIYEPAEITSLVVRTDASTFDTTFERSAETTNSEPNAISDSSIFEYVHFYSGSTRTRYETTLDWEDARTTTTETTFLDEYSNATAAPIPDQCRNVTCWNGGACDATDNGPKCACKFGWDGTRCERVASVKVVAFTGRSYLAHRLNNNASTRIGLKLKTLSNGGTIFYAQLTTNAFVYLYIRDGFLKFQFSCGIQTMLFGETKYRIDNGYETSVLATIMFNGNGRNESGECYAALRINDTIAMSGEQTAATDESLFDMPVLYVGGFPKYLLHQLDLPTTGGIIGCMRSLQVDGVRRDIYSDAFDGYEISECSSLACISNPCHLSATCIEEGHSWSCVCPSGYIGKICNISICDDNPCQFGATCVEYPTSGFLCLCPLGKHGLYCEEAYRLPATSLVRNFEIRLKFIPETVDQIALMLFIGREDKRDSNSDYFSLSFIKGYIALTWNLGAGPRRIFTPRPIKKKGRKMHAIKIGRSGAKAWLFVDGFRNTTGRSLARDTRLNVTPILYVGGHRSFNFANLPNDLPLHSGFAGCIFDVELHTSHAVLALQKTHPVTGRSVAQCGTSECSNFTCQHDGICLQYGAAYSCLCSDGWFGPICAHRRNLCDTNAHKCATGSTCVPLARTYECDCPIGLAGRYCERIETRLSDIQFSGKRSYLLYRSPGPFNTKQFSFEFELKPFSNDRSLVLYVHEPESNFFASITLKGGILEFRFRVFGIDVKLEVDDDDDDIVSVKSGAIVPVGEWTKIRAGRFGQKLYLFVNDATNSREIPPDSNVALQNLIVYLGGTKNLASVPYEVTAGLPKSYNGCVRKFYKNYEHIPLTAETINSARNIADCDGTPCGADVCANGGTCWLNATLETRCMCSEEYRGDRCEHRASCDLVSCKNNGRCVLQRNDLVCHCPLGWFGPFCEQEMPSVTPFLKGNSYIIVDKKSPPIQKKRSFAEKTLPIDFVRVNFSTTSDNGLLLWNAKSDEFFGIGIENGNLKVVWSIEKLLNQFSMNSNISIDNGLGHSVLLKFNQTFVTLTVDEEEIFVELPSNNLPTMDDLFYIGGFPDNDVSNQTNGVFVSNFYGCIQEFAFSEQTIIRNFKRYKGDNVGSCFDYVGFY